VTDRRLVFIAAEVPVSGYEKYAVFRNKVNDDRDILISLTTSPSESGPSDRKDDSTDKANSTFNDAMEEMRRALWALPVSSDSVAAQYENDTRDAAMRNDIEAAISSLRSAVEKDPKFQRAWLLLGSMLAARMQQDAAVDAYKKGVSADPSRAIAYKVLGFALRRLNNMKRQHRHGRH
jgi:predicted Zn-dependent protease